MSEDKKVELKREWIKQLEEKLEATWDSIHKDAQDFQEIHEKRQIRKMTRKINRSRLLKKLNDEEI